jgi:hypothetical protein
MTLRPFPRSPRRLDFSSAFVPIMVTSMMISDRFAVRWSRSAIVALTVAAALSTMARAWRHSFMMARADSSLCSSVSRKESPPPPPDPNKARSRVASSSESASSPCSARRDRVHLVGEVVERRAKLARLQAAYPGDRSRFASRGRGPR